MKVLTLTTLYPNKQQPNHGVFVENRLLQVQATGEVNFRVVAPVPWFPFTSTKFGNYGTYARVPKSEERSGIKITHPRFAVIPKIGETLQPWFYEKCLLGHLQHIIANEGPFDLLDVHYLYPDGVAAEKLAKKLGLPFVMTARGTDVSLIGQKPKAGRKIISAVEASKATITVCEALRSELIEMSAQPDKVHTLRNGVDLTGFHVIPDRKALREKWHIPQDAKLAVSVGGLIERKGNRYTIDAIAELPDVYFLMAGDGPERIMLQEQIDRLGVSDRIRLLGPVPHKELSSLYGAADISILASSREGWANVLLESMACGTAVAATAIWGTPEVITDPIAGVLISERNAESIKTHVAKLLNNLPDRAATRIYAEQFSWDDTAKGVVDIFQDAIR